MLSYIIGAFLTLAGIGTIVFKLWKGNIAEALLQNQDTKGKVIELESYISKDKGLLAAEQAKRDQLSADLKAKENANVSKDELLDFVNSTSKPTDSK